MKPEEMIYEPTSSTDLVRFFVYVDQPDGQQTGPGYYFYNEHWIDVYGPFTTLEQCREALYKYANSL